MWSETTALQLTTVDFAGDLGSVLRWGKISLLLVPSNRTIPVNSTLGWISVVFRAYEITQLLSVVFCVVRAVHAFLFKLVKNGSPNNWRPVGRLCSDRDSCFWQDLYVLHRPSSRVIRDLTQAVPVSCLLLSKEGTSCAKVKCLINKKKYIEAMDLTHCTCATQVDYSLVLQALDLFRKLRFICFR